MIRLTAWVTFVARLTAIAGGFVLVLLTLLTVASISGRAMLTMANFPETSEALLTPLLRAIGGFFNRLGAGSIAGETWRAAMISLCNGRMVPVWSRRPRIARTD